MSEKKLFGRSEQGARGILWSIYEGENEDYAKARLVASFSDRKEAWDYIESQRQIAALEAENKRLMALIDDDLAGCAARMDGQAFDKTRSDMWQVGWRETDEEQRMKAENKRLTASHSKELKDAREFAAKASAEVERLKERIEYALNYQKSLCNNCNDVALIERDTCSKSECHVWISLQILRGKPVKLCGRCGEYHENEGNYCDFCVEEKRKLAEKNKRVEVLEKTIVSGQQKVVKIKALKAEREQG